MPEVRKIKDLLAVNGRKKEANLVVSTFADIARRNLDKDRVNYSSKGERLVKEIEVGASSVQTTPKG